ncbi:MAG: ribonucleoside-diphosphate reductase, adenosylcobalamin-dependent [Elusimicrobia bacterium RIFCSPHIGHO2_02_FULL_57_9]|nr:MAG: ribonucleoside-diphosphate reductase, adenosylcobalamin-dependent [Elusimicrobia bacterium RIFCSPHIGHO2_02_FULL_57_9]
MKQKPEPISRKLPKVHVTENQAKVIKDKYLRDAPSVEVWLDGIAHNIALGEILFHADAGKWGACEGVRVDIRQLEGPAGAKPRMLLFHAGIPESSQREANFAKLVKNLDKIYKGVPEARKLVDAWTAKYFEMLSNWDFLPNSPTLMNAGRELQQLSACYVLPVPDSMEGITKSLSAQSLIQKSGGGTGFAFSQLRPKGDIVKKTQGVASGAISFMQIFDKLTDVVKQGGTRRGANMGILHYTHPEIKDFITMKAQAAVMENFNVSVAIDEKFMKAVAADAEYDLINPHTREVAGKARAKEIFDMMIEYAWKSGDPGYVVIDRINNSGSNPTPGIGQIESTNPCGEQPLLPWEPCNLGSINLSNFVEGELMEGRFNYKRLASAVTLAARFLDDVIEVNNYPLPEIEIMAKGNRRIGLGVMGYGEALVKMGIPYDSPASLDFATKVMRFINDTALAASESLGKERGIFPNWKNSIYDEKGAFYRGESRLPRHCARTTIAPTGTIAIAAGLQGSGIEPFFAIAYTRYNAKALEAIKKGESPAAKDVFFEVNPLFKEVAQANNYFGLKEKELWERINANHKSVRGIAQIPEQIQKLFVSAHDVPVDIHVKIQAAFQKHTDNGVSKTINLPNSATTDDVRSAYMLAYELGCKGITIYRDGSKAQQVLNLTSTPTKSRRRDPSTAFGVSSEYYQIKTGYGPLHIHINYDERGPYQVFTNIPPLGTEISALTSLVGIMLSKYLAEGGDPLRILKHLNSVKGDKPIGFGENRVDSIAHAIAIALRQHLKKTGWLTDDEDAAQKEQLEIITLAKAEYCPKCYSSNVAYESGCSGPTCHDCGFSECS